MSSTWNYFYEKCPVHVSHEKRIALDAYIDLLLQWQEKINLVADTDDILTRHLLDSAQLAPLLPPSPVIADLGSGAGFPGLALSIITGAPAHLVESDQRKAAFLREAARITRAPAIIHAARIEAVSLPSCNVITSRALAPLVALLHLASPHLHSDTLCLFPKGKNWAKEKDDAHAQWRFDLHTQASITDPQGVILQLTNVQPL